VIKAPDSVKWDKCMISLWETSMVQEFINKTQAFVELCIRHVCFCMAPRWCCKSKSGCLYIDKREFLPRDNVKYSCSYIVRQRIILYGQHNTPLVQYSYHSCAQCWQIFYLILTLVHINTTYVYSLIIYSWPRIQSILTDSLQSLLGHNLNQLFVLTSRWHNLRISVF